MNLTLSPKILALGLLALVALWSWVPAFAGGQAALMSVTATVLPICRVATVAAGAVNVSCTAGAPYGVAVDNRPASSPARQLSTSTPSGIGAESSSGTMTVTVTY